MSAHDCVGSNTFVHTRGNDVIRVVPRENDSINESWISDRDRFSYTAVKSEQRLIQPMMREAGELKAVDWESALNAAAEKLSETAGSLAALISPQATLEEQYLAQKLLRGLGSNNIDHRLSQVDFSNQDKAAVMPWLGRSLDSLETLDAALIVAGSLRFEQPLLSHRLRKAALNNGARISSIGHVGGEYNFDLQAELTGSATQLLADLGGVALALAQSSARPLSPHLAALLDGCEVGTQHRAIADSLVGAESAAVIVGVQALANPQLSLIQELCEAITGMTSATLGYLSLSANSAGACLAGATPHRQAAGAAIENPGENAAQILAGKHKLLLTFGINPLLDTNSVVRLADNNETVIAISSYDSDFIQQQADIVLPLAAVVESSGTFVNVEGLWQSFKGCVRARGESRQGWKILCALGQVLQLDGFDYPSTLAVKDEVKALCSDVSLNNLCGIESSLDRLPESSGKLQKISYQPIYASDDMARLAGSLQATPLMKMQSAVVMNQRQAENNKLASSQQVQVKQGKGTAVLPLRIDDGVADGCVFVPSGIDATRHLADAYGKVSLEKVS